MKGGLGQKSPIRVALVHFAQRIAQSGWLRVRWRGGGLSTPFRDARPAIPRWVRWSQRTKVWVVEDLQRASPTKLPPPHSEAAAPRKRVTAWRATISPGA